MNRITFRLGIALLTFVVGVAAVSLWFLFRRSAEEKSSHLEVLKIDLADEKFLQIFSPDINVKWIYISEPLDSCGMSWLQGKITIFYENGDWGQIWACLYRDKNTKQIQVQFPYGYELKVGKWSKEKNEIIVSIEGHYFSCMIDNSQEKSVEYPIVEKWNSTKGDLEDKKNLLRINEEKFRRINIEDFIEAEEMLKAPLEIERYKTSSCD